MKSFILDLTPPIVLRWYNNFHGRQSRFSKRNNLALANFPMKFEVLDFSYIDKSFRFDFMWGWWSRIYEYPLVLDQLTKLGWNQDSTIHNTCWGSQGCHILFKDQLEEKTTFVINSDINPSTVENTTVFDLRKNPPEEWRNHFDFVLNVSTLEEIRFPHVVIFENLLAMVKPGGHLIATFDLPGLDLKMFEELFKCKIRQVQERVNGQNSPYQMSQFGQLEVGFMVVRKL
jgi:hypothetical protein